jgi:hypothetical protein
MVALSGRGVLEQGQPPMSSFTIRRIQQLFIMRRVGGEMYSDVGGSTREPDHEITAYEFS